MNKIFRREFLLSLILAVLSIGAEAVEMIEIQPSAGETETSICIELDNSIVPSPRFVDDEDCWHIDFQKTSARPENFFEVFPQGPLRVLRLAEVCEDPPIQRLFCHIRPGSKMKLRQTDSGWVITFKQGSEVRPKNSGADSRVQGLISPDMAQKEILIQVRKAQTAPLFLELAARAGVPVQFRDRPKSSAINIHGRDPLVLMHDLARHLEMCLTLEDGVWWLSDRKNPLLSVTASGVISPDSLSGLTVSEAIDRVAGKSVGKRLQNRLPGKVLKRRLEGQTAQKLCPRRWIEQVLEAHGTSLDLRKSTQG